MSEAFTITLTLSESQSFLSLRSVTWYKARIERDGECDREHQRVKQYV